MADIDDLDLLKQWQQGDAEAGVELVRRHHGALSRFLYDKVGAQLGKEIAQDVFLTLCERRGQFREESTFRAYLFGIARWKVVESFRRVGKERQRFDPTEDSILDAAQPSASQHVTAKIKDSAVVKALRSLTFDDQVILELHFHQKLTQRELSAIFDVPQGTIASRILRARQRLEQRVAEAGLLPTNEQLAAITETSLHSYWSELHELWRAGRTD